jgi:hypothetical protein
MAGKVLIRIPCVILVAIMVSACPWKECTSADRAYLAEHLISHPETINVGDTIWVTSQMDCEMLENLITNTLDHYCESKFSFPMNVVQFEPDSSNKPGRGAVHDFDFINIHGRVYNARDIPAPDFVNQVEFNLVSKQYKLHFGMVCKIPGIYFIALSPGGAFGKDHCDRAGLDNIILNPERGQEMYIQYRHPHEVTERDLRNRFCFEVH